MKIINRIIIATTCLIIALYGLYISYVIHSSNMILHLPAIPNYIVFNNTVYCSQDYGLPIDLLTNKIRLYGKIGDSDSMGSCMGSYEVFGLRGVKSSQAVVIFLGNIYLRCDATKYLPEYAKMYLN